MAPVQEPEPKEHDAPSQEQLFDEIRDNIRRSAQSAGGTG